MADILVCSHLKKQYGGFTALKGINLALPEGKIIGLLGPNGSGKTTLIKLASGLLLPTAGEITIGGFKPGVESKKIVSYLPERNYLDLSKKISRQVDFMADFYKDFNKDKAYDMLSHLNIDPKRPLKDLSKGNREKVQLILVMSREAKLYLLDEPIGGADPAAGADGAGAVSMLCFTSGTNWGILKGEMQCADRAGPHPRRNIPPLRHLCRRRRSQR